MGTIVIYYKYIDILYPEKIKAWQLELSRRLGLTGRIIVAHEGINGTAAGSQEAIEAYVQAMREHTLFNDIDYKFSEGGADLFPRFKVSIKNEIVRLGIDPKTLTAQDTGKHLSPTEVHQLMEQKPEDLVVLDTRNTYEWCIGSFENAVKPPIETFRELPQYIDEHLQDFANKKVLMYCTAGVRCERASAYLKSKGVAQEVFQINGGIQRYIEQYPDGFFRGKNYVFDGRVTVPVNNTVLTNCEQCNIPYDEYTNCVNALCNKQAILCPACIQKFANACCVECQHKIAEQNVPQRAKPRKVVACSLSS